MDGIYYVENSEQYAGGDIYNKNTVLCFEMSENDWLIAEKSAKFLDFVDYIRYRTAYRYIIKKGSMYHVTRFTEGGVLHSVKVSFSLACHDWLKLRDSQVFQDLLSYLEELETRSFLPNAEGYTTEEEAPKR